MGIPTSLVWRIPENQATNTIMIIQKVMSVKVYTFCVALLS